jgi:YfiH family protein
MLFLPEEALADNVFCFTTSVHGGVSATPYKSFNLGMHVDDNEHRVATNRELLAAIIAQQADNRLQKTSMSIDVQGQKNESIAPILWLNQQHSNIVCRYSENTLLSHTHSPLPVHAESSLAKPIAHHANNSLEADAIYTENKNTPLAVMTADCLPIVVACRATGKIAAIHAGWRGLLNGIIMNTIKQFDDASSLAVWIGPNISQRHFEVSNDIIDQFSDFTEALQASHSNKYLVDLAHIARLQLAFVGVLSIQTSPVCTYANRDCFSHRRATHAGSSQTGRMATVIVRV